MSIVDWLEAVRMVMGTSRPAGNLPGELTSLVGRRAESAEVKRLLTSSRLVTLTGPGGVGKTRLALQVGRTMRASFKDGVWLLAVADVTRPDLLSPTLMSTLGRPGTLGSGIVDVADHVGDRQLLLVLDNCEHLTAVCAELTNGLLRACRNLRVLATSREPLRIGGEALFQVPPLALPDPAEPPGAGVAERFEAIALFRDRAVTWNPKFSATGAEEQAVVALCRRLDGLPLAIELAAAATRLAPVSEVLGWAEDPLLASTLASRTAPSRHQTLRATMDYSYDLCSQDARAVWARMSVFRGGADVEAIEEVCAGQGLSRRHVRAALAELVDKSVAGFDAVAARYRMLETIRQFGQDRLRVSGEESVTARAHRDRFAELAAELGSGWFGPDQQALLDRVLGDQANIRVALEFCLSQEAEIEVGLNMASSLWPFWVGCGLAGEGRHWLEQLLGAARDEFTPERTTALWVAGYLATVDGDVASGLALLEQCHRVASRLHDEPSLAHVTHKRGFAELMQGRLPEAIRTLELGVRLERDLGPGNPHLAEALLYLGSALCYEGSLQRSVEALEEARSLCADFGDQLLQSWTLVYLGLAALADQRVPEAIALVGEALTKKRALDDVLGIAHAIEILAWAAQATSDAGRCARLLAAAAAMSQPLGPHLAGNNRMLEWHARYAQQARDILGPREFEAASQYGRELTVHGAIEYALDKKLQPSRVPVEIGSDLPLTPREREIAILVAKGMTSKEIAAQLFIAHRTVDTHVEHILIKMDFRSRTQIATLFATLSSPDP